MPNTGAACAIYNFGSIALGFYEKAGYQAGLSAGTQGYYWASPDLVELTFI